MALKDHSCPAGKRSMCTHAAALAYKLVQNKRSVTSFKATEVHRHSLEIKGPSPKPNKTQKRRV